MIFDCESNYTVRSVFKQNWSQGTVSYLDFPRPRHGIVLITSGSITFVSEGKTLETVKGDIVFLPKNSYYKTITDKAEDYLINFDNDAISINTPTKILKNAENKYGDIFNKIIDMRIKGASVFSIKSQFFMLLDSLTKDMDGSTKNNGFIDIGKQMLESENDYSINQIAKECAVSVSGFRSAFKNACGVSPIEYKMSIKINRAKYLLQSTSMSITEISDNLGFYDTAYFCKTFKKYTGCSPKNYAKKKSL